MIQPNKHTLLFDGDCGICTAASERAEQLDRQRKFDIRPYQSFPETELARFGLSYAICNRKLQVITRGGRVYAGAFAVNHFLWQQFPWRLLVALLYALPVLLVAEIVGYALVARYRQQLSRWLGLTACRLNR